MTPEPTPRDMCRFWDKVSPEPNSGCWLWDGATTNSYGEFYFHRRILIAHRFAYRVLRGPIPGGLQLDHLCRVRCCVNPDHLEIVTQQENIKRGDAGKNVLNKTHCPQGHPYSGEHLGVGWKGVRICRTCRSKQQKEYRKRRAIRALMEKEDG